MKSLKRNEERFIPLILILLFSCGEGRDEKQAPGKPFEQQKEVMAAIPDDGVPFEREGNFLFVNALIQDTIPARLILDTGAQAGLTLDSAFVRKSQLISPEYYDGDESTFEGRVKSIRGRNSLKNRAVTVKVNRSSAFLRYTGVVDWQRVLKEYKADGVLGMDFMDRYVMEINYQGGYVIFHQPEEFEVSSEAKSIAIAYDTLRKIPMMDVKYNVSDGYTFRRRTLIDLGYNPAFIGFGSGAVEELNLLENIEDKVPGEGWAAGMTLEEVTGFTGKIKSIEMHGLKVDTPAVRLHTSKRGLSSLNLVLLGNYVLSHYDRVFFHFRAGLLYVEEQ